VKNYEQIKTATSVKLIKQSMLRAVMFIFFVQVSQIGYSVIPYLIDRGTGTVHNAGIHFLTACRHIPSDMNSFSALFSLQLHLLKTWRRQFYMKKLCQRLYFTPSKYVFYI
jgi:hypothetical protein